jgi:DNA-binding beta-propeller fold protein YncE
VNGGKDAKLPNAYISVVDVAAGKTEADIKIDSNDVEGVAFEKSGPRMFVNVRGKNAVEVYDRTSRELKATWSIAETGKNPTSMAFDEDAHRLFLGTRVPGKLVVLDSDSGKVVTSYPAAAMIDDLAYDSQSKRIYFAGTEFLDVFHEHDADHYDRIGHIATAFRAKTGVLVPELNRYYLAVPHHEKQTAELRVYEVLP